MKREILIFKLTIILLLLHGGSDLTTKMSLNMICILMLVSNKLSKNKYLWMLVTIIIVQGVLANRYNIDNHKYLIMYWCIACAISVWFKDVFQVLAINARILIGLTFLLATFWKIYSFEYFDGSFLNFTFMTDERMKLFAVFGGDLDAKTIYDNYSKIGILMKNPHYIGIQTLNSSFQLESFSLIFSYLTLIFEGLIGILFLINMKLFSNLKDYLLMSFIFFTYFLFPIIGFGFILSVLGISQVSLKNENLLLTYFFIFMMLQLTMMPLDRIMLG